MTVTTAPYAIRLQEVEDRVNPSIRGLEDGSGLLAIDFGEPVRPRLVTKILDRALDGDGSSADRPLSWRIAALLGVWRETSRIDPEFHVVCPSCEEELELSLPLAELLVEIWSWELPSVVTVGPDDVEMRLPTGSDLERWALSEDDTVMTDLGLANRTPAEVVERALSEADPLVDFALNAECPECGQRLSTPIDLEAEALYGLETARNDILREVHRLALAYSWTEDQVLAIPPDRRRQYLRLIEERMGR
jgi:hypothetical protein